MRVLRGWIALGLGLLALGGVSAQTTVPSPAPIAAPQPVRATGPVPASPPAAPTDAAIAAFIDGYVQDAVDRSQLHGVGLVVLRDGRPILSRGYGYADLETRRRVDPSDTLFRQASVSKLFTWVLVMQLVEEGRLNLDRDINAYLNFRVDGKDGRLITMRHLMTHSAGFAERLRGVFNPSVPAGGIGQLLRENVPQRPYAPGEVVSYSNYSTGLAAHIVERLRGRPFDALVQARILAPLGMRSSTFAQPLPAPLGARLATSYGPGSRTPLGFDRVGLGPAGSLTASPEDMARFTAMLMNGGGALGGRILRPETVAAMMRLVKPVGPHLSAGLGLGMMVDRHRGVAIAGHGGNLPTTTTDLVILPEQRLGWTISVNTPGPDGAASRLRANLTRAVINRFFAPVPASVTARGPSTAAEAAGTYISTRRSVEGPAQAGAAMAILELGTDPQGNLRIVGNASPQTLARRFLPQGRDLFADQETGGLLVLQRDADGRVVRVASGLLSPISAFDRAPAWYVLVPFISVAGAAVLVFAALAAPLGWALRRAFGAPMLGLSGGISGWTRPLARLGVWVILGSVAAWMFAIHRAGDDLAMLFDRTLLIVLPSLAWASVISALVIAVDAVAAWRDPTRGRWRRVGMGLVALAALAIAGLMLAFELTSYSTDW